MEDSRHRNLTSIRQISQELLTSIISIPDWDKTPTNKLGRKMHLLVTALIETTPSIAERLFKLYFSPIFRGIASYVLHQLINLWALR